MKRIFAIVLALVLVLTLAVGCSKPATATYEEEYKLTDGKKAIIILPGLLASGLYDQETGEALWDPVKSDDVDLLEFMGVYGEDHQNITANSLAGEFWDLMDYATEVLGDTEQSIMRRIMCDDKGDPANPNVVGVPVSYEGHLRYGALNSYKWWAEGLLEEFGDQYEVVVYNYNWLTDTRYAARDFARFMRQNNYTQSILIGHSMGGIVANEYLALGAESRARVDKFIAVAVPFYGSYMASSAFENPYGFMDLVDVGLNSDMFKSGFLAMLDLSELRNTIMDLFDSMIIPFLYNMKSVYQLLPSSELVALQAQNANEGAIQDGQKIAAADLYDWYCTRPFARSTDAKISAVEAASLAVRDIFKDWQTYRDGFYVDKPQGKVFACDLVDTYYLAGDNVWTELGISILGETRTSTTGYRGDGTVPLLSATRGKAVDNQHVFTVNGMTHIPMGTFWADGDTDSGQKTIVLNIIRGTETSD